MQVTIVKLGQPTQNVELPEGSNVSDAIKAAGIDVDGFSVAMNGKKAELNTDLVEGATILVAGKVKGGAGTVAVIKVGDPVKLVEIGGDESTVALVLDQAGIQITDKFTVSVSGNKADFHTVVRPGQRIQIIPQVKGG